MKVRLSVHRPDLGKVPGDEITLDAERAMRLIEAGQAVAVVEVATAAVIEPQETAALPKAHKPEPHKPGKRS